MTRPSDKLPPELPPRLIERAGDGEGDSEAVGLLRKFERQTQQLPPEEAVWNRTLARLVREGPRHRLRLVLATACGVILGAAGTQAYLSVRTVHLAAPQARETAAQESAARVPAAARHVASVAGPPQSPTRAPAPDMRRIRLTSTASVLPPGPAELIGEAEIDLSADGKAWATSESRAAIVDLDAGSIALHVEKRNQESGRRFDVRSGGYRFTVLGTRFRVSRADSVVRLAVTEGRVGVFRGERRLAVVTAGGTWSSTGVEQAAEQPPATVPRATGAVPSVGAPARSAEPVLGGASPPAPAPTPPPTLGGIPATAPPPVEPALLPPPSLSPAPPAPAIPAPALTRAVPGSSCVPASRGDVRQLLSCYLNEARGTGLTAEVALYEAARLRRDNLTDLPGALELLREHRRRFPAGTLSFEVRLSMAELLPKLAQYREALVDIDWLLDAQTGPQRRGELLLLRGHVLREGFENWAGAERAYAQAAEARGGDGRAADPAAFWRAVCLESLGRKDEARRAYATYLARPRPALREQAELRLRALEREHSGVGGAQSR